MCTHQESIKHPSTSFLKSKLTLKLKQQMKKQSCSMYKEVDSDEECDDDDQHDDGA